MGGVEYQVTKVDPTNPETKGMVYQVYKVSEEIAATLGGKVYRARIINDPTSPTVAGKVYQIVLIDDPDDPSVKGMVYNAILTGGSEAVVVGPAVSPLSLPDAIADSLSYVKAFGGTEQRNLPAGYTQLEYIESDGTQYIDTGYTPTVTGYKANIKFMLTSDSLNSQTIVGFNKVISSSRRRMSFGFNAAGVPVFGYGDDGGGTIGYINTGTLSLNTMYDNTYNYVAPATVTVNGTQVVSVTDVGTRGATDTIYVMAVNDGNTNPSASTGKWYYAKIWDENNNLVRDLIPAKRNSDNAIGMYDIVNGVFYQNAGTGDFVAGPDTVPTPDTPMDIVSNNGVLKYGNVSKNLFDEDYPNLSTTFVYKPIYLGPGTYTCSYSLPQMPSNVSMIYFLNGNVSAGASNGVNQVDADTPRTVTTSTGYVTLAYRKGDPAGLIGKVPSDYNCMIESGSTATSYEPYRLAVYTDGTVETLQINTLPAGYTELEYIESTGTQYIDTGIVLKGTDVVEVKYSNVNRTNTSCLLFGYYKSSGNNRFAYNFWQESIRGGYFYYGTEQEQISTPPTDDGLAHIIKMGNGSLYHDSTLIKSGMTSNFTASENMFLFASSGPGLFQTKARVHYAKITDNNNTLIFDGVPARRNSDNVLGMYDTVSEQFFTNAGTGTFVAGAPTNTATAEMLLKVGNYEDVQEILSGAITRSVGVKVLDGTEDWKITSGSDWVYYDLKSDTGLFNTTSAIATHFDYAGANQTATRFKINTFSLYNNGNIAFKSANTTNTSDWASWLADQYAAGTPVIVIYPLATPTTESVTGQPMQVQQGDNFVEITQASLNGLKLEAEYEKEGA